MKLEPNRRILLSTIGTVALTSGQASAKQSKESDDKTGHDENVHQGLPHEIELYNHTLESVTGEISIRNEKNGKGFSNEFSLGTMLPEDNNSQKYTASNLPQAGAKYEIHVKCQNGESKSESLRLEKKKFREHTAVSIAFKDSGIEIGRTVE